MVNPKLLDYIGLKLQQNVTQEAINKDLISQGYQQQDIDDAFSQISSQTSEIAEDTEIPVSEITKKKNWFFGKIETGDEAVKTINYTSIIFYGLAIVQIVLGYFVGETIIVDSFVFAICAFLLNRLKNKFAAIILLIFSIGVLVSAGINMFGGGVSGHNVLLAIIMIWFSVRSVQATFVLQKLGKI